MKYLVLLIACVSLSGCFLSKPNRADRKIKKAMELDPKRFQVDTIVIHDTVVVESFMVDTVKEFIYHDTVTVINNDKVHLKYFYDTTRLEIWHEVECKGDTVYFTRDVVVDKVVESSDNSNFLLWVLLMFSIALTALLFHLLMKISKRLPLQS